MPYFNNNSSILFGCSPPVAVGTTCRDNPDERKGGEFGTTTGSSVALRLAGDPPYTLLDADDRLLHAQPRQARCASSVRYRKKPGTVQYSQSTLHDGYGMTVHDRTVQCDPVNSR